MSWLLNRLEVGTSSEDQSERLLESLDMTHELERILSLILESGPELDPTYLAKLRDYFNYLVGNLNIPFDNPVQFVQDVKERVGINDSDVNHILFAHGLPEILRQPIEKIIAGRNEELSDKSIYHRLAMAYHPDQTVIDLAEAEETFKLIGQMLYDKDNGFERLFDL